MSLHVAAVTFDCSNALKLAEFWSAAFGRPIDEGEMGASDFFARISGTDGDPSMMFIQVPEGKATKNRVHLDLAAADHTQEVARLVSLGARVVHDKDEWGVQWTTLSDPEGNEFCVATH